MRVLEDTSASQHYSNELIELVLQMIHKKAFKRPSIYNVLETLCKMDSEPHNHNELYTKAIDMLMGVKPRSKVFKDAQSAIAQLKKLIVWKKKE